MEVDRGNAQDKRVVVTCAGVVDASLVYHLSDKGANITLDAAESRVGSDWKFICMDQLPLQILSPTFFGRFLMTAKMTGRYPSFPPRWSWAANRRNIALGLLESTAHDDVVLTTGGTSWST